jgi:hypothetical protein
MKEHKAKEFFGSASKDYEGLIRKTSGDLRLVKAPAMDIIKLAKAIKDNNEKALNNLIEVEKNKTQYLITEENEYDDSY